MTRELTPAEKRLIEREFAAKEERQAKRRRYCRRVFLVGVVSGTCVAALRGFDIDGLLLSVFELTWLVCLLIYVGGQILPLSFSKDMDPSWHLNPWKDALGNLTEGRTLVEALTLIAGPRLLEMACTFVYLSLK